MNIVFNKRSLLAAIEIAKDKNITKNDNLNYLESIKTTFDIKNGQKLINLVGLEIITELSLKINCYE